MLWRPLNNDNIWNVLETSEIEGEFLFKACKNRIPPKFEAIFGKNLKFHKFEERPI